MSVLIQRVVTVTTISWLLYSCTHKSEVLVPAQVAFDNVKFQLPKSWVTHRVLRVFPPDCSSCSGSEYAEYFGSNSTRGVFVEVDISPRNAGSVVAVKEELASLREKNPNLITVDTLLSKDGWRYHIEIAYKNTDDTYHKIVKDIGSYRTISLHFQGENNEEFKETARQIQNTVYINPSFLVSAKL